MRKTVALLFVAFGLVTATATASGSGSGSSIPQASIPEKTPEQQAAMKYKNGVKHLKKAKKITAELATVTDAEKRAKLDKKLAKEYAKAIKDFQTATRYNPQHYAAFSDLGYSLRKTGNYPDSLAAYEQSLTLQPGYTPAIEYRAEAHLALGRLDEVKQAYMDLFVGDRPRADELAAAIDAWLQQRRSDPGELDAEVVERFAKWADERRQIASQTSSLTEPASERAW